MQWLVLVLVTTLSLVTSMPPDSTTARSSPLPIGDSIKRLTNQLMEVNATSPDVLTYDTRTPPKFKNRPKIKTKMEIENSHAGIAIPVDEDQLALEETTKKVNFYKIERPTTNSGLSTWILLSGQNFMTTIKPPKKPAVIKPNKPAEEDKVEKVVAPAVTQPKPNRTIIETPNRVIKPLFKKRTTSTTTRKPTTTKISTTTARSITTKSTTKLTKIKASLLSNAVVKKVTNATTTTKGTTPSPKKTKTTSSTTTEMSNVVTKSKADKPVKNNATLQAIETNILPAEAKEGELDLIITTTDSTKKRKPTTKRKKNKTRRRKPSNSTEKLDSNSTKIVKHKISKEKPIGTQLYNYLSREVMPTVGVGLVGLVVTAGLASYFLYPFGIARRSYDIDRKDKEGGYYYNNEQYTGIAEEEAIGKVIAGMPANSVYGNTYKTPTSRNTYPSGSGTNSYPSGAGVRYRAVDRRSQLQPQTFVKGSVETVQLTPKQQTQTYEDTAGYSAKYPTDSYQPISYNQDVVLQNEEPGDSADKKYVVGNIPKEAQVEEATPAAVPEHGPRSLRLRREAAFKNEVTPNETENEINFEGFVTSETTTDFPGSTIVASSTTASTTTTMMNFTVEENLPEKYNSFLHLLKDLFHIKVRLGLDLIKNATQSISTYVSKVQARIDDHYRNYTESRH